MKAGTILRCTSRVEVNSLFGTSLKIRSHCVRSPRTSSAKRLDSTLFRSTLREDGPHGAGSLQQFIEYDPEYHYFNFTEDDRQFLQPIALFDVLVNNADRKGDHILAMTDGHRHGVDHGLTFHRDHKLRTVLWGWLGDALTAEERDGIDRVSEGLHGGLGRNLADLLSADEIAALAARCARLRLAGRFPAPSGEMSAVPWPLF